MTRNPVADLWPHLTLAQKLLLTGEAGLWNLDRELVKVEQGARAWAWAILDDDNQPMPLDGRWFWDLDAEAFDPVVIG